MSKTLTPIKRLCGAALSRLAPTYCETELALARENKWAIDTPDAYCRRCGASAGPGAATETGCAFCADQSIPWDRLVRLGAYEQPVSRWVLAMKFTGSWLWASWFGNELAKALPEPGETSRVVVCPVPMHWRRRLTRGYNQSHLIAAAIARARRWPVAHLLRRTRYTQPQTSVPPSRRAENIRGSIAAKSIDLTGWHVWLVDDVKTSGQTLAACTRQLHRAGAQSVSAAVVAVADPRNTNFKSI